MFRAAPAADRSGAGGDGEAGAQAGSSGSTEQREATPVGIPWHVMGGSREWRMGGQAGSDVNFGIAQTMKTAVSEDDEARSLCGSRGSRECPVW